ncbi:MAG: cytochrome c [Geminicoccaceae bacterium]|nr:MAG: cytochrome c [Geminicoccaceae bacterium]
MRRSSYVLAVFFACGLAGTALAAEIPEMTEAMLNDPDRIENGRVLWEEQCRHCHGRAAYPGKAPRLTPRRYAADFVYHRITYGFRGMPGWIDIYDQHERIDMVAYILSGRFSP